MAVFACVEKNLLELLFGGVFNALVGGIIGFLASYWIFKMGHDEKLKRLKLDKAEQLRSDVVELKKSLNRIYSDRVSWRKLHVGSLSNEAANETKQNVDDFHTRLLILISNAELYFPNLAPKIKMLSTQLKQDLTVLACAKKELLKDDIKKALGTDIPNRSIFSDTESGVSENVPLWHIEQPVSWVLSFKNELLIAFDGLYSDFSNSAYELLNHRDTFAEKLNGMLK